MRRLPAPYSFLSIRAFIVAVALTGLAACVQSRWQCGRCGQYDRFTFLFASLNTEDGTLNGGGGMTYRGAIRHSQPHGAGEVQLPNGYVVAGEWRSGRLQPGKGSFEFADGSIHRGEWRLPAESERKQRREDALLMCLQGDCRNGQGILADHYLDSVHVGAFRDGRAAGQGVLFWRYRQFYIDGRIYEFAEKEYFIYAGDWHAGKLRSGVLYCMRKRRFCNYLRSIPFGPEDSVRVDPVDRFGLFETRARPRLAEFKSAAEFLLE